MFCVQSEDTMFSYSLQTVCSACNLKTVFFFVKSKDGVFCVHHLCIRLQYLGMASALSLKLHKGFVQFSSYLRTSQNQHNPSGCKFL